MGVKCHGSMLFELKPTPPRRPSRTAYEDNGSIDSIRMSTDGRFRTIPSFRSDTYIDSMWQDFVKESQVMATLTDAQVYRNVNAFNCLECPYKKLCQAELNGEDVDFILKTSFHQPLKLILE